MTGNIWFDLHMSLAEIEAEIPDMSGELPRIPTVGNAMANVGLRERSTMHSTPTACLAVRALSRRWARGRFPRCKCSSRRMTTAAPVRVRP
jgi:hypothetical protein